MMKYPSWDTLYMFHHMIEPRFGRCLPGIRFRRTRKNSTRVCTLTLDSGNLLYFYIFTKSWIQSPWLFEPMLMGSIPAQFEKVFHEVHGTSPWRGDMPVQCFITFWVIKHPRFVPLLCSHKHVFLKFHPKVPTLIWVHSFFFPTVNLSHMKMCSCTLCLCVANLNHWNILTTCSAQRVTWQVSYNP